MTIDPNRLVQLELHVSDLEKSLCFYEKVFSWPRVPAELYPYYVLEVPENCPFGIALVENKNISSPNKSLIPYFEVELLQDLCQKVEEFGGAIKHQKVSVPGYGHACHVEDPDGHIWGIFQSRKKSS